MTQINLPSAPSMTNLVFLFNGPYLALVLTQTWASV